MFTFGVVVLALGIDCQIAVVAFECDNHRTSKLAIYLSVDRLTTHSLTPKTPDPKLSTQNTRSRRRHSS